MGLPDDGPPPYVPLDVPSASEGSGSWAHGKIDYAWSLRDTSDLRDHHDSMRTSGPGVLMLVKAKVRERGLFERLLWIQYTEAVHRGRIYTPRPTPQDPRPSPWRGIDRYRQDLHADDLPYTALPDDQQSIDRGRAYDGRLRSLYSPEGADSVDVDWSSSGGMREWGHFSVVSLIGRGRAGREWRLGSFTWRWSVDAAGEFSFGGRAADEAEVALWRQRLGEGYPRYVSDTFAGEWTP